MFFSICPHDSGFLWKLKSWECALSWLKPAFDSLRSTTSLFFVTGMMVERLIPKRSWNSTKVLSLNLYDLRWHKTFMGTSWLDIYGAPQHFDEFMRSTISEVDWWERALERWHQLAARHWNNFSPQFRNHLGLSENRVPPTPVGYHNSPD